MKVTTELKALIMATLADFEARGIAEPPYVCVSHMPIDDGTILRTKYGSVQFYYEPNAPKDEFYVVSRRDFKLAMRTAVKQMRREKVQ